MYEMARASWVGRKLVFTIEASICLLNLNLIRMLSLNELYHMSFIN